MPQFKSERHFQTAICNFALVNNWLVYNHPDSRKANVASSPGFPDIVLAKLGVVVFIECKMPKNKAKPVQLEWQKALQDAGLTSVIVYPDDYEAIKTFLMGKSASAPGVS